MIVTLVTVGLSGRSELDLWLNPAFRRMSEDEQFEATRQLSMERDRRDLEIKAAYMVQVAPIVQEIIVRSDAILGDQHEAVVGLKRAADHAIVNTLTMRSVGERLLPLRAFLQNR